MNRHRIIVTLKGLRSLGPRENHQQLRLKLSQRPRQILVGGVFAHEFKHGQIPLGVTDHACVILQLQQADITVVVLEGFELEFRASSNVDRNPDMYTALRINYDNRNRNGYFLRGIGRMKPGVTMPTFGIGEFDPVTIKGPVKIGFTDQQIADIVAYLQSLK